MRLLVRFLLSDDNYLFHERVKLTGGFLQHGHLSWNNLFVWYRSTTSYCVVLTLEGYMVKPL